MISIGFAIKKNELWYSVLEGTNDQDVNIIECKKHNFQSSENAKDLMFTFKNLFSEIIGQYSPNNVVYKLSLDTKKDQIPYMHFSLGVLALICKETDAKLNERTTRWITASQRKKELECQNKFSDYNLKGEKLQATLIAWYEFKE